MLNADGSIASNVLTLSTRWKAYDALSVAYNTRSDTFFMVSHSSTAEDGGVEIDTNGNPIDNGFIVTAAVEAATSIREWPPARTRRIGCCPPRTTSARRWFR